VYNEAIHYPLVIHYQTKLAIIRPTYLARQSTDSVSFCDGNFYHHQLDQYLPHQKQTIRKYSLIVAVVFL